MTLKQLRMSNSLSRKELADMLGIAVPTLCRYENGDRNLPVHMAMKIGSILHFPWHELYGPYDQEPE